MDSKPTTGYVKRLFGNVIYWRSRKQKYGTKASILAEYVALSEAASELKFVRELLKTFNVNLIQLINVHEDNTDLNITKCGKFY